METKERIKVYIQYDGQGNTKCICPRWKKGCGNDCIKDVVIRDKFYGLKDMMHVDKYGRTKSDYRDI